MTLSSITRQRKLGTLFNIPIIVDFSAMLFSIFFVFGFLTGDIKEGWSVFEHIFYAFLFPFMFYGFILSHELAHSLTAKTLGVKTKSITLMIFGGAAHIEQFKNPIKEFLISIAGPILSLILSAVSFTIFLFANIENLILIQEILTYSTIFNFAIALFNFLPILPLDGGRVFHSLICMFKNENIANKYTSIISRVILGGLILTSACMMFSVNVPLLGTGFSNGIWLLMISLFIFMLLKMEERQKIGAL